MDNHAKYSDIILQRIEVKSEVVMAFLFTLKRRIQSFYSAFFLCLRSLLVVLRNFGCFMMLCFGFAENLIC